MIKWIGNCQRGWNGVKQEKIAADLTPINLVFHEPLSGYTYTKTGGPADILAFPKSKEETQRIIYYCNEQNIPWLVLGNASNLIVKDGGIRGFVIMLDELSAIHLSGTTIEAEAGAKLIDLAKRALEFGLSGLEFACGIPGSVGGAIFMNAGAYDGEIQEVFESAEFLTPSGEFKTISKEEMHFSYRHSIFQEEKNIILSGRFACKEAETKKIAERMAELTRLRQNKQPLEYPSCGSVFKRPAGHFTGQLIQKAGLQGLILGGAQVSKKHAGFIVNLGNATATDYIELIEHIQKTVFEKFDVHLETEVRIIGENK